MSYAELVKQQHSATRKLSTSDPIVSSDAKENSIENTPVNTDNNTIPIQTPSSSSPSETSPESLVKERELVVGSVDFAPVPSDIESQESIEKNSISAPTPSVNIWKVRMEAHQQGQQELAAKKHADQKKKIEERKARSALAEKARKEQEDSDALEGFVKVVNTKAKRSSDKKQSGSTHKRESWASDKDRGSRPDFADKRKDGRRSRVRSRSPKAVIVPKDKPDNAAVSPTVTPSNTSPPSEASNTSEPLQFSEPRESAVSVSNIAKLVEDPKSVVSPLSTPQRKLAASSPAKLVQVQARSENLLKPEKTAVTRVVQSELWPVLKTDLSGGKSVKAEAEIAAPAEAPTEPKKVVSSAPGSPVKSPWAKVDLSIPVVTPQIPPQPKFTRNGDTKDAESATASSNIKSGKSRNGGTKPNKGAYTKSEKSFATNKSETTSASGASTSLAATTPAFMPSSSVLATTVGLSSTASVNASNTKPNHAGRGGRTTRGGRGSSNRNSVTATSSFTNPSSHTLNSHKSHNTTHTQQYTQNRNYSNGTPSYYGAGYQQPASGVYSDPEMFDVDTVKWYIRNQIEYYFSIENLCRDMYFRAQMDSTYGTVPLLLVANFNRVRSLIQMCKEKIMFNPIIKSDSLSDHMSNSRTTTSGGSSSPMTPESEAEDVMLTLDLVTASLYGSDVVEVIQVQGEPAVRKLDGWEYWLIPASTTKQPQTQNTQNFLGGPARSFAESGLVSSTSSTATITSPTSLKADILTPPQSPQRPTEAIKISVCSGLETPTSSDRGSETQEKKSPADPSSKSDSDQMDELFSFDNDEDWVKDSAEPDSPVMVDIDMLDGREEWQELEDDEIMNLLILTQRGSTTGACSESHSDSTATLLQDDPSKVEAMINEGLNLYERDLRKLRARSLSSSSLSMKLSSVQEGVESAITSNVRLEDVVQRTSPQRRFVPVGESVASSPPVGWLLGRRISSNSGTSPSLLRSPNPGSFGDKLSYQDIPAFQHPSHLLLQEQGFVQQKFSKFFERCMRERTIQGVGRSKEMKTLFRFYGHFLRKDFNQKMYEDFRRLALEDAREEHYYGLQKLFQFYSFGLDQKGRMSSNVQVVLDDLKIALEPFKNVLDTIQAKS